MLILLYVEGTTNKTCLVTDLENIRGLEEHPFMNSVFSSPFQLRFSYFFTLFIMKVLEPC